MGKKLGLKIKQLRSEYSLLHSKKMTQKELAEKLNISRSYLGDIESGRTNASDEIIYKLSSIFEIDVNELLKYKNIDYTLKIDKLVASPGKSVEPLIEQQKDYYYKITSRDKKQYIEEMRKANEAFFMNDELNSEAKKEMLDLMSQLFWEAKSKNKRKK